MNFETALTLLKNGQLIFRAGWNGKGMWLKIQKPDSKSLMSLPYIYMKTAGGELVPWVASHSDLLSTDWFSMSPKGLK